MKETRYGVSKAIGVWGLVAVGVAVACSQIDGPGNVVRSRAHAVENEVHGATYEHLSPNDKARLENMKAKYAWAGQIHNAIMRDLMKQRKAMRLATTQIKCQAVLDAVMKHVPDMRAHAPSQISDADLRAFLVQRVASDKHCKGITTSNVISTNLASIASYSPEPKFDSVTDAGFTLAQAVVDAVSASSGLPDDVAAATDEVLAANTGLSDADYALGVYTADIAVSSSSGWYDFGSSGGFDGDSTRIYQESLLALQWWKAGARALMNPIVATDALSGLGGMYIAHIAGADDSYTLWVTGAASAAIGSGVMFFAI